MDGIKNGSLKRNNNNKKVHMNLEYQKEDQRKNDKHGISGFVLY